MALDNGSIDCCDKPEKKCKAGLTERRICLLSATRTFVIPAIERADIGVNCEVLSVVYLSINADGTAGATLIANTDYATNNGNAVIAKCPPLAFDDLETGGGGTIQNCNDDTASLVYDPCVLSAVQQAVAALNTIVGNTDQIETLQQATANSINATTSAVTTLQDYVDQVESLLSALGTNADQVEGLLNSLGLNTVNIEALLAQVRDKIITTSDCSDITVLATFDKCANILLGSVNGTLLAQKSVTESIELVCFKLDGTWFMKTINTYNYLGILESTSIIYSGDGIVWQLNMPSEFHGAGACPIPDVVAPIVESPSIVVCAEYNILGVTSYKNIWLRSDIAYDVNGIAENTQRYFSEDGVNWTVSLPVNFVSFKFGECPIPDNQFIEDTFNLLQNDFRSVEQTPIDICVNTGAAYQNWKMRDVVRYNSSGAQVSNIVEYSQDGQTWQTALVGTYTLGVCELRLAPTVQRLSAPYTVSTGYRSVSVTFIASGTVNGVSMPIGFTWGVSASDGELYVQSVNLTGNDYIVTEVR